MTGFPCCPVCHRAILPHMIHENQPQPEGASHTVCSEYRRPREFKPLLSGPLVEVLSRFFDTAVIRMSPFEWSRHQDKIREDQS